MPERPHPNLSRVREAMREADERDESAPPEPAPEPEAPAQKDDEDAGT